MTAYAVDGEVVIVNEPAQKRRCECTQKLQSAIELKRGTCNECERARRKDESAQWDAAHDASTLSSDALATTFSADWLMQQSFPPIHYVIPGIISEGLTLLVGAPKVGKSWLVLAGACAVAQGSDALGHISLESPRAVLYLALEDGPRRLQDRMRALEETGASGLHFATSVHRDDVLNVVTAFMEKHRDERPVVFLDTLGKVMPPAERGENEYQRDYRVASILKAATDDVPGSAVIVVHHTNKAVHDDFLNAVSGTQGLAGAADTIVLLRRERTKEVGTLSVTSRDAVEGEYQLIRDGVSWILDGDDLAQAREALVESRATVNLGDRSAEILRYVNDNPAGVRAADVEAALDIADARTLLGRLHASGRIEKPARGLYTPVASVASVASAEENATHATHATPSDGDATCALAACDGLPAPNNYGTCASRDAAHLSFRSDAEAGVSA